MIDSLVLQLMPLLALLRLADQLLPAESMPERPIGWSWLLRQATGLVLFELLLVLGGLTLIQTLSWAVGRLSTTLAGLVVVSGGLLMLCWCSARYWLCHCWRTIATALFRRWITAGSWRATTGSRCWRC